MRRTFPITGHRGPSKSSTIPDSGCARGESTCRQRPVAMVSCLPAILCMVFWLAAASAMESQITSRSVFTSAEQIRRLSGEQAAAGYPVRIRGVVTGSVPEPDFFVQDKTAGIYVEGNTAKRFVHHLGDLVELEGVTGPGKFAPVIKEVQTRVVGKGSMPRVRTYSFAELADGQLDSQWVQVRGIIRSVSIDRVSWPETALALRLASGGGEFSVRVPVEKEGDFSYLIDNEVLIEGVCGSRYTSQRQLSGIIFYVPQLSYIKVQSSTPEVPFSALLRFSPGTGTRHRVRVHGVVAYQQLGNSLFLQSGKQGLRVLTEQGTVLQPGDEIEVLGFPEVGESAPVLADAVFHRVGHSSPPQAVPLVLELPWEQFDGALVSTEATLLDRHVQGGELHLLLRKGEHVFEATLQSSQPDMLAIPVNSQLKLVGVCLVRSGGLWALPQSLRILLRSANDVVVLRTPSWWNFRHTAWLLGITAGILLLVLAWVAVLSKRWRTQMAIFRERLQRSGVVEERNRIAREIHDSLEQELAGITMQLDLAADCFRHAPEVAKEAVDAARQMSRHSMLEARRSVWDLRCQLLEQGDLVSAMAQTLQPLAPPDRVHFEITVGGQPSRLPTPVEMSLLRIAQEAVANAVHHGHARNLAVELQYDSECVRLRIVDNGNGFDPARTPPGHFGLLDMKERAQSMGACLNIDSATGRGTVISVEVPIYANAEAPQANTYSGG
jgi:signal transduction histidine kinase